MKPLKVKLMAYKILFVCLGNICRSPAAENIMDHLLHEQKPSPEIICDSAGTSAYHIGSPPDRRMQKVAQSYGIQMKGEARQIQPPDLAQFDLILTMDHENYRNVLALDHQGQYRHKVKMMCSYCTEHKDIEVPDPYYGGENGFHYVIELLTDACKNLLASLEPQVTFKAES